MSEACNQNCAGCEKAANCVSRDPSSMLDPVNAKSSVKKVIGIVSGKGGVGKSLVTALSAISANRIGYTSGILDADITGPSIPKLFGIKEKAYGTEDGLLPAETAGGIKLMSVNLILDDESDPVAWRVPILSSVVRQFWTDVVWGDLDILFVDMPPGTGDVMLTTFQSIPVDGIIVVTSPQELVSMIVGKAVRMAEQMNIPVLGLIENMSYVECPDCGKKIKVFGESHAEALCAEYGILPLGQIPLIPGLSEMSDQGGLENAPLELGFMDGIITQVKKLM